MLAVISFAPVVCHVYLADFFGLGTLIGHSLISILEGWGAGQLG
jgi:hypothetical protein